MAKIKISELAFELGCESKELIAFLQENGIEAKRSNSSIEETDAEVAKKHFGKASKKAEPKNEEEPAKKAEPKKEEKKAPEVKEAPVAKEASAPKKEAEKPAENRPADAKAPVKKPAEGGEPIKKKKKIIVVSNMNNSKMGGGNQGGNNGGFGGQRRDNRDNRNGGQAPRKTFAQSQNVYHPIKPLTAPSQLDSYNTPVNKTSAPAKPVMKKEQEQPAAAQVQPKAPVQETPVSRPAA